MLSDLRFQYTAINFYQKDLLMYHGGEDYGLYLSGGYLQNCELRTSGPSVFDQGNDSYIYNCHFEDIILQGTVILNLYNTFANLVNYATIQNASGVMALEVAGNLENHGWIINNPAGGFLNLNLAGDLYNYNTIANHHFTLTGTTTHTLFQGPVADAIRSTYFSNNVSGGNILLRSDLTISNSTVDMYGKAMLMYYGSQNYDLYLNGGKLYRAVLETDGFSTLTMDNDAYLQNVNAGDLFLQGTIRVFSEVYFGETVNYGTICNHYETNIPTFNGNFINYGTCANNPEYPSHTLRLSCLRDFVNYGVVDCYQGLLNGIVDQYFQQSGSMNVSYLTLVSNIGSAAWYFNGVNMIEGPSQINVDWWGIGVWQPFSGGVPGRQITFGSPYALATPANVGLERAGEALILTWDQVANAYYYYLYTSDTPEGPFTAVDGRIFDDDPDDGVVNCLIEPVGSKAFYYVTAGN
jgi:hypothetical protein